MLHLSHRQHILRTSYSVVDRASSRGPIRNHPQQEAKRLGRKRGRAVTSKRRNFKRKEMKERLVKEIGAEEFRKMVQNDHRKREGTDPFK